MRLRFIAIASMLAFSSGAFAKTAENVLLYQNGSGMWSVMPSLGYLGLSQNLTKNTNFGTKLGLSGYTESVEAEYGINDMIAVGLKVGEMQSRFSYTDNTFLPANFNIGGMTDIVITEKTKMEMAGGNLKFGAQIGIPPGTHNFDQSYNQNATTGGMWATPFVGYEMALGDSDFLATKFTYSMMLSSRKAHHDVDVFGTPAYDSTTTGFGGKILEVMYEHHFSPTMKLGVDLGYSSYDTSKTTDRFGTSNDDDNGTAGFGWMLYGLYYVPGSTPFAIVPVFGMVNTEASWTHNVQTSTATLALVNMRIFF